LRYRLVGLLLKLLSCLSVEWDSLGAQVVSAGSHNCWLVSGDHSSVGVGDESGDTGQGTSIWQSWGNSWHSGGDGTDGTDSGGDGTNGTDSRGNWGWGKSRAGNWANQAGAGEHGSLESGALGSQVVSPGSHDSRLISWGHSAIRVGDQLWDTCKGADVWAGSSNDGGSWGNDWASPSNDRGNRSRVSHGSSSNGGWGDGGANQAGAGEHSGLESGALGSQMVSPGGNDGRLISWGHSAIGVGDQLWDMDGSKG